MGPIKEAGDNYRSPCSYAPNHKYRWCEVGYVGDFGVSFICFSFCQQEQPVLIAMYVPCTCQEESRMCVLMALSGPDIQRPPPVEAMDPGDWTVRL